MRNFLLVVLALVFAQAASAYTFNYAPDNHPIRWMPGPIPVHIKLGFGTTSDGLNFTGSMQAAIFAWNSNLSTVQLIPIVEAQGSGSNHDGNSQIFFASTYYGTTFGSNTLAITLTTFTINKKTETDMVFNNGNGWDSYRGNRSAGQPYDIQRVALHELGHVLGLDHPDQATDGSNTSVVAIMRSIVSDSSGPGYDSLAPDDILGAQNLYGASGGTAPANDNFANAPAIGLFNGFGHAAGSNIYPNSASREPGEPLIVGNAGAHSVWWKWTASDTGTATIDLRGSLFDTTMGVYTGSSVDALSLVADNDDENHDGGIFTSLVNFPAETGTTYYIAVDGFYNEPSRNYFPGETGKIQLHISQIVPGVAPTITNPSDVSVNVGSSAQFSVTATGSPTPGLQWQQQPAGADNSWSNLSNDDTYSGVTTGTLTIIGATPELNSRQYRCSASNASGIAFSSAATLTILSPNPPVLTSQPDNFYATAGANVSFTSNANSVSKLFFQWQRMAFGSGTWVNLSNGSGVFGTTTNQVSISGVTFPMNGDQFRCVFTNGAGSVTSNSATLIVGVPVSLASQSGTQVVLEGVAANFAVNFMGTPLPSLKWQRQPSGASTWTDLCNGGSYSGVTTGMLTVSGTTRAMDGDQFRCVATNVFNTVYSLGAILSINYGPTFDEPLADLSVPAGWPTAFISSGISGSLPVTLQWQRLPASGGGWANLADGGAYSDVTTPVLSIIPVTASMNGDQFRLVAASSIGAATSNAVTLTVTSTYPIIGINPVNQTAPLGGSLIFAVAVIGTPTPTLQWQRMAVGRDTWSNLDNGDSYSGVTTATLTLSNITAGMNGDQFRCVATNNVATVLSNPAALLIAGLPPSSGDLNGDGKTDILWENTSTGDRYVWLMNGTVFGSGLSLGNVAPVWRIAGTGDLNGDGKTDILWENTSTGDRYVWLMNGTVFGSGLSLGNVAPVWRIAGTGDLNGDGKTDILWENTSTGDRYVWLMNGTVFGSGLSLGNVAPVWRIAGTGDLNGDGKTDILWENTSTGDRYVWLMNGTVFGSGLSLGNVATDWSIAN